MFLGIAGPSEAAATGALGTLVVCLSRRTLNWEKIVKVVRNTLRITVMMFMIMAGSKAFSQILAYTGASVGLIEFLTSVSISPVITLITMQIILLILGCLMDGVSIMMITLPIFMPIVHELGFDPVWFAVIFMINIDIGGLTPPFGLSLFTMKGIAPDNSMQDIIKASVPFLFLDLLAMALIMVFPAIALWLPSVMR
jgi:tripartite ATP-independent transporter DctM subunit